jgi:low temperature requirement protein LtrA
VSLAGDVICGTEVDLGCRIAANMRERGSAVDMEVRGGVGRNASTLELFFDLVYVFAITQVVGVIGRDASFAGLGKGALLLWLLWWAWSTYTWTTNWTGTEGAGPRLFLLLTMGVTLLTAMTIPDAFGEASRWFAATYFVVRILANVFYWVESASYPDQRAAFFAFFPLSALAAALVLVGGFLDGPWLIGFWIAAALFDAVAAVNAARGSDRTWAIDASHFAERNGLFIIVALGESVVGIGLTAAGAPRDAIHVTAVAISFIIAAGLWWSYFDKVAPTIEKAFKRADGVELGRIARDAYSLMLYPLVVGVIYFAVSAEEIVAHPDEPLEAISRFTFVAGVALVLLAITGATYRVLKHVAVPGIIASVAILALGPVTGEISAVAFAGIVAVILVATLVYQHVRPWAVDQSESEVTAE